MKIIEIKEDVKIVQEGKIIILEKGDKIEILDEKKVPSKDEIVKHMVSVGYNSNDAKKRVDKNYDFLIRNYGDQDLSPKKAAEVIMSVNEKVIEIKEDVKIVQDGYDVILERGDMIKVIESGRSLNEKLGIWAFIKDSDNPHLTYNLGTEWLEVHKDEEGGFNLYIFKNYSTSEPDAYYAEDGRILNNLLTRKLRYRQPVPQRMLDELPVSPEW